MDRQKWDSAVGWDGSVSSDLEWELFQTRRLIESASGDDATINDPELKAIWEQKVKDIRAALSVLWSK